MMEIELFSAKEINTVEDYECFYHTKSYIQQKSDLIKDDYKNNEAIENLMLQMGYKNWIKFREHRIEWDNLIRNIPLKYLKELDVDVDIIKLTIELDQQEYQDALQIPLYPKCAVIRYMAAVYGTFKFPRDTPENEAVVMIQDFQKKKRFRCCINFPTIKTIWLEPDGKISTSYYEPKIRYTKCWLMISENGKGIGKSYIK